MYDLCLTCCRDLRQTTQEDKRSHDGHSPTNKTKSTTLMEQTVMIDPSHLFPDWKANSDGSIPCPPKESGGCGCQSLPLRRIFKMNWVAKLVKNAEEMVNGCKVNGVGGVRTCLSCSWSISSESSELVDSKLIKASHREDSSDNYLYSPAPQDIKIDGICHFRKHWHKGEPIAVKGMADFMLTSSWDPMVLWRGIQEISEENVTENNYILKAVDCLDWSDVDIEIGQFVEGYFEGRIRDDGWQEMLKLKDWPRPSALEEFLYYQRPEFLSKLPLLEYIHSKWGLLNLAAKLPHDSLQADVGPKLFIAYGTQEELGRGDSVTNLHVNMGDVVFLLMNTSEVSFHGQKQPKSLMIHETVRESDEKESLGDADMVEPEISLNNGGKSPDLAPKGIDYGGGLSANDYGVVEETMHNEAVTTSGEMNSVKLSHSVKDIEGVDSEKDHAGALWDVFRRQDVSKLNEYLKIHWNEFQSHARLSGNSSGVHPLHDQDVFLNRDHLRKLKEEFNIEPWTFEQHVHEAVFIPAGCPLQMRNLQSSVQLCLDFLSPDSLGESVSLAQDIRRLPNDHGAKLQMLEVGKMSLYAASSAIKEIQKLTLDPIVGPELAFEDRNLTALVSENIEKMVKRRQITCI